MNKTFSSSISFRQSLETRLQEISKKTGIDLQRVRRKVAFERFLVRLFAMQPYPWILKGGYSLEIRLGMSRATKDLDLGTRLKVAGTVDEQLAILLSNLQERAMLQMEDHFQFRVESSAKVIASAPYGGFRFPIRSAVAGRLFVAFSLDIGIGDAVTPPVEEIEGTDWLKFCGIPPAKFEAISLEQQFAEKIHAMTIDRGERENSRVKDLIDVLLLIKTGLNQVQVVKSMEKTFNRRGEMLTLFQSPTLPVSWRQPFSAMAAECGLNPDFDAAVETVSLYLDELRMHTFDGSPMKD